MSVRLATEHDIDLLDRMLRDMGQRWSPAVIRETVQLQIVALRETDGTVDGFYVAVVNPKERRTYLGPGDGPHESHEAWLRAICEMGLFIEEELVRRLPKEDVTEWWTVTRIWPTVGPLRDTIDSRFNFAERATSNTEGYDLAADGAKTYWQKRPNLVEKAKAFLAAVERRQ